MNKPASKEEALDAARQYRKWSVLFSEEDPTKYCPTFMNERDNKQTMSMLFAGFLFHTPLLLIRGLFFRLGLWRLAKFCAELRIRTDHWSVIETAGCGLSDAFTIVGLCRLKLGDLWGAIDALNFSWKVWPCAHTTTIGFDTRLACALSKHPEAESSIKDFAEIAREFKL